MKLAKRILIGLAAFVFLVFLFLLLAPMLFKDRIIREVKTAANENLEARVDFADANVSFLRSFPEVSLSLEDYSVIGIDTFAGLPLVTGEEARVDLGFWSVIAGDGNYNIDAVTLERPDLHLLVLSPELANYLIVPETEGADVGATEDTTASATITLDHFEINNGSLIYDDRTTETYLDIRGLNTTGDGDFTASVFDLNTYAEADAFTLTQSGITYLDEVRMVVDALINVDADAMRYTFTDGAARINELDLTVDGSIDLEEEDILFDLTYGAPANDFRQLWSLIPAAYTEGYERVQTSGTFTLNGSVNGAFNSETETYPAFTLNTNIDGGSVQYPGRPVSIDGIDAAVEVNSPGSDLNDLIVSIPRFNFNLGGDPFRGSFRLATPMRDPNVDARLNGAIDLENWSSAIPLEGVSELGGRIVADITLDNVSQSAIDAGRYADVNMAGDLRASNIVYVAEGTPAVRIAQARAEFSPQYVDLQQFTANLGRSDISAEGRIDNILAYFTPDQTMRGSVTMQSNFFDANEWIAEQETATAATPAELNADATVDTTAVFDRFDFDIDARIDELVYGEYRPSDINVAGNIKPNRLEITDAGATLERSTFSGNGVIRHLFDYTFDDGVLTGDLNLNAGFFSVDDFMPQETAAATNTAGTSAEDTAPASAPIPVPQNINLNVNLNADRVQYTDITMNDVRGTLKIQDGAIMIDDGRANLLGGSMGLRGTYDTAEEGLPGFHFAYDIQNFDFGQAFGALNTFAALAPVGRFISGNFNSELVMEGKLGEDMLPQLNSIDANGLLSTAEARIASFKPLQAIGNALNVKELRENSTLRDIIATFEIQDGTVRVKPFDFALAGIPMQMGGTHGLDTDMDYTLRAAVPRALIAGSSVGGAALGVLDRLSGQASKLGVNLAQGDTLNLGIGLTGTISNPKANVDLLGAITGDGSGDQSATGAIAGQVEDRLRDEVDTRVDSARTLAEQRTEDLKDTLRTAADEQADRLKQEAGNRLRDALGVPRDTTRRDTSALDSVRLPDAAKDAVEDVKKELERFNPFKRKKGGG